MLRPGAERVASLGGLHKFMNWARPILTDSGGFQVMSLSKLRKLTEEGVTFQSHIDGSRHTLTPEGANFEALRLESGARLTELDFPGYSIGGLAVGEGREEMFRVLDFTAPALPSHKPRYLMGVGKPADIVGAVARGVDMFDCVAPTRSGRHGQAWTSRGPLNLKNAAFADDPEPLDPASDCPASRDYSKAYLHHLFRAGEYLGPMLLSWHNLHFYQQLMSAMRAAIAEGRFADFVEDFREKTGEAV